MPPFVCRQSALWLQSICCSERLNEDYWKFYRPITSISLWIKFWVSGLQNALKRSLIFNCNCAELLALDWMCRKKAYLEFNVLDEASKLLIIWYRYWEWNTSPTNRRDCSSKCLYVVLDLHIGCEMEQWRFAKNRNFIGKLCNLWVTELPNMSDRTCHVLPQPYLT